MKRMFIFMDLRGESLSSQSTIPAKIQKGSLRPVGVSEETSRGGVFGIGCMWFWDPGIGWCCFQRFGSLRLNLSACNFYHLEWQVNKNLGRKFFRIFTRSPDSWIVLWQAAYVFGNFGCHWDVNLGGTFGGCHTADPLSSSPDSGLCASQFLADWPSWETFPSLGEADLIRPEENMF